jgi:hypothetical protein
MGNRHKSPPRLAYLFRTGFMCGYPEFPEWG